MAQGPVVQSGLRSRCEQRVLCPNGGGDRGVSTLAFLFAALVSVSSSGSLSYLLCQLSQCQMKRIGHYISLP